jgi:adenylate kinase
MNLAIIGPPGSGKRSHSNALATAFHLPRGSCGNLFRQQLLDRTALGILARKYMERGELVPDEVVDAMLEEWVLRHGDQKGLVLDGFPRTAYQAEFLAPCWLETTARSRPRSTSTSRMKRPSGA